MDLKINHQMNMQTLKTLQLIAQEIKKNILLVIVNIKSADKLLPENDLETFSHKTAFVKKFFKKERNLYIF